MNTYIHKYIYIYLKNNKQIKRQTRKIYLTQKEAVMKKQRNNKFDITEQKVKCKCKFYLNNNYININKVSTPNEKQILADRLRKQTKIWSHYMLYKRDFSIKHKTRLKVKECQKEIPCKQ